MLFLSAALSLLSVLVRKERRQLVLTARDRRKKARVAPRRIAASLAFATLFFAGAALSAGAGNGVVQLIDPASDSAAPADTTTTTTTTTSSATGDPATDPNDQSPAEQPPAPEQPPAAEPQSSQLGSTAQTAPPAAPASQSPDGTASNMNVAGVRSTLKVAAPCRAQEAGRRGDRTRAAGQRRRWFPPVSSARRFRLWSRR